MKDSQIIALHDITNPLLVGLKLKILYLTWLTIKQSWDANMKNNL